MPIFPFSTIQYLIFEGTASREMFKNAPVYYALNIFAETVCPKENVDSLNKDHKKNVSYSQ
jgi:hypothetical protein